RGIEISHEVRVTTRKLSCYHSGSLRDLLGVTYGIVPGCPFDQEFPIRHHHSRQAHTEHAAQAATVSVQGDGLAVQVTHDDPHVVVAVGPADELDATVELVAPEERHRRVRDGIDAREVGQQVR